MEFRKKQATNQPDHDETSVHLRNASQLLDSGNYADGLTLLDSAASQVSSSERRCQIASIAARANLLQGRFGDAANNFAAAWSLGADTQSAWFGAAIGQVLAQLRNVDVENAFATASSALDQAKEVYQQYTASATSAGQTLSQNGSVSIGRVPIRPSVAAFRLGQQFWDEGEPDKAYWFFNKAVEIEPQGACRARIAIANIALLNQEFQSAYDGAREALTIGHFRKKTLSAWPVLIAAAQSLNHSGVEQSLINGLAQATPTIRGRAKFVIAKTLRSFSDPAWVQFADVSASEDNNHILQAESTKLKVASATNAPESTDIDLSDEASTLLATPNLGRKEWLGAAKATLTSQLIAGNVPDFNSIIATGVFQYGEQWRSSIIKGLALACQKANRSDLALSLLRPYASTAATAAPTCVWLLAQLEAEHGNLSVAAGMFASLRTRSDIPTRYRMLATLQWARVLVQSGDTTSLATAGWDLVTAAQNIQDFELLLDLARQMTQAPDDISQQAATVFNRGQDLAIQAFSVQQDPQGALEILFKLARRQSDFGAYAAIISAWQQLSDTKRDWLWCRSAVFWQYLALVTGAYRATNRFPEADSLSDKYLEDTATPPNGLAEIGVPYALSLLTRGNIASAFEWFNWITGQVPTHVLCSYAYYWLALKAKKLGDLDGMQNRLQALRLSLGTSFGLAWMKELDARSQLLSGAATADIAARSEYSEGYLQQQQEGIQQDQAKL